MRHGPRALAGSCLAAAVFFVAACGSSTPGLLTSQQAGALNAQLDRINHKFSRHHCTAAQGAAQNLKTRVAQLPASVSPTVRSALAKGALTVEQYVAQDCVQQSTQSTAPAPPAPPTPTTTQTAPPPPPKTKTKTTGTTTNPGATPPSNAGNKPKDHGNGNPHSQGNQQ